MKTVTKEKVKIVLLVAWIAMVLCLIALALWVRSTHATGRHHHFNHDIHKCKWNHTCEASPSGTLTPTLTVSPTASVSATLTPSPIPEPVIQQQEGGKEAGSSAEVKQEIVVQPTLIPEVGWK